MTVDSTVTISTWSRAHPPRRLPARGACAQAGAHLGCEHGVCGACTLLIDGAPTAIVHRLTPRPARVPGVRAIEGLEHDPMMTLLRAAFHNRARAATCGCMHARNVLVTARDIVLLRLPSADADRIRLELAGNLCRCTGYAGVVHAIRRVLLPSNPKVQPDPEPSRRRYPRPSPHPWSPSRPKPEGGRGSSWPIYTTPSPLCGEGRG